MKIFVPNSLYKELKDQAEREGVTVEALIIDFVKLGQSKEVKA